MSENIRLIALAKNRVHAVAIYPLQKNKDFYLANTAENWKYYLPEDVSSKMINECKEVSI